MLDTKATLDDFNDLSDTDLANMLITKYPRNIVGKIFDGYHVSCENMHKLETNRLDELVEKLARSDEKDKISIVVGIISLVRSVSSNEIKEFPIVNEVKCTILRNVRYDLSAREIAEKVGMSMYYMMHSFKKQMGITITEYKNTLKIDHAKNMLVNTELSITDIGLACGFENSSYFSKMFARRTGLSPTKYRKNMRKKLASIPSGFMNVIDKDLILYDSLEHIAFLDRENMIEINAEAAVKNHILSLPDEKYAFLHEAAIIEHHGRIFAAWYNNEKAELQGRTPIRFSVSDDGGDSWSEPETVAFDPEHNILYCPPIFGISEGKLYIMLNQMVSADHIHSLDLYVYDENRDCFDILWSRPIPFKLNTNAYRLPDGKLMICGRTGELDGFPTVPAVLISDDGKMDSEWRSVDLQETGTLPDGTSFVHPEPSAIIHDGRVYVFVRNDLRNFQLVYISEDNGETWSKPIIHDIPFVNSKTYSGTLSDGRNYIIGNMQPNRRKLIMLVSEKESMRFNKCITLQNGHSKEFDFGTDWHYPCAYEADGKLYVVYTVNLGDNWLVRGGIVSVVDVDKI